MDLREKIVANGYWGAANEPRIHYRQSRPIDGIGRPYKLDLWTDCSGFVTLCYNWAGAPDPNHEDYDGEGFTGTLLNNRKISKDQLLPGDFVVTGPGTGDHVVMVLKGGADPTIVSHGTEGGPLIMPLSKQLGYHRPPYTYLRVVGLDDPAPTPQPAPEEDEMHHAYFVQRLGAKSTDPVWLASTTMEPSLVQNFDVAHVVAFCTGVTIHPVPDGMLKGLAERAGKKEVTWLLDPAGEEYFHTLGR